MSVQKYYTRQIPLNSFEWKFNPLWIELTLHAWPQAVQIDSGVTLNLHTALNSMEQASEYRNTFKWSKQELCATVSILTLKDFLTRLNLDILLKKIECCGLQRFSI